MKKQILTACLLFLSVYTQAQSKIFSLTIKLNNLKQPAKAYLVTQYGWSDSKTLDSAEFKNGQVTFKGEIVDPVKAHLLVNHSGKGGANWAKNNDVLLLYLEDGNTVVTGTDSVTHANITGSKLTMEYHDYSAAVLAVAEKTNKQINAEYAMAVADKKKDKGFQAGLMAKMNAALKISDSLKYVYIKHHPDSYLSLEALQEVSGKYPDITKIEQLFKALALSIRNTEKGKKFAEILYDSGPTSIGATAPDFTQSDVNDIPIKLSGFKGKYVLLDFWASWCGPCRAENPNVLKAYEKYKNKNFTVLGVSLDQPGKKAAWLAAIKADGLSWTQVSDLQFWNNAVAKAYNIRSIPQNFLIDPNGKIVAKNLRGDALTEKLAQLLK